MITDDVGLDISLDLYYFTITLYIKPLDWQLNARVDLYPHDNMIYLWIGCFQLGLFW